MACLSAWKESCFENTREDLTPCPSPGREVYPSTATAGSTAYEGQNVDQVHSNTDEYGEIVMNAPASAIGMATTVRMEPEVETIEGAPELETNVASEELAEADGRKPAPQLDSSEGHLSPFVVEGDDPTLLRFDPSGPMSNGPALCLVFRSYIGALQERREEILPLMHAFTVMYELSTHRKFYNREHPDHHDHQECPACDTPGYEGYVTVGCSCGLRGTIKEKHRLEYVAMEKDNRDRKVDPENLEGRCCAEFVKRLVCVGLKCSTVASGDDRYLFLLVSLPESRGKFAAAHHEIDLKLDFREAVKRARETKEPMRLAVATDASEWLPKCDGEDEEEQTVPHDVWKNLHIEYNDLYEDLFCKFPLCSSEVGQLQTDGLDANTRAQMEKDGESDTLFLPSMRLRLLYELCSDSMPKHGGIGAALKLEKWKIPPCCYCVARSFENCCKWLSCSAKAERMAERQREEFRGEASTYVFFYPVQSPYDEDFRYVQQTFYLIHSWKVFWRSFVWKLYDSKAPTHLQTYFGEYVAYYFAYVQHLFQSSFTYCIVLSPFIVVFIYNELRNSERPYEMYLAQSVVMVLWGQLQMEIWKRREARYSVNWGMVRVEETSNPRPDFVGAQVISQVTGHQESRHGNRVVLALRMIAINGVALLLTGIFGGALLFCETQASDVLEPGRRACGNEPATEDPSAIAVFGVSIGFTLSVELITALVEELQDSLADCENQRLECHFEWALIFKRWMFYFFAHGGLVLWMLFLKPQLQPCQYITEFHDELICGCNPSGSRWSMSSPTDVTLPRPPKMSKGDVGSNDWYIADTDEVRIECCVDAGGHYRKSAPQAAKYLKAICKDGEVSGDCDRWDHWQDDAQFKDDADKKIMTQTRGFLRNWLLTRIWLQNFLEWIIPKIFGFICARGIYPMIICDFLVECILACRDPSSNRKHVKRKCCCTRRAGRHEQHMEEAQKRDQEEARRMTEKISEVDNAKTQDQDVLAVCELNLDRQVYWKVLDNTNELAQQYMMMMLCAVVFPIAPVLFLINVMTEFHFDIYRMFDRRQAVPIPAAGLSKGWQYVLQLYNHLACVSNVAICTFRTPLIKELNLGFDDDDKTKALFFFICSYSIIMLVHFVEFVIPDVPKSVKDHLARQTEAEQHFARYSTIGTKVIVEEDTGLRKTRSGSSRGSPRKGASVRSGSSSSASIGL